MFRRSRGRAARGVLALVIAALWTAEARADKPLSLDEALAIARANNRDLKVARARLEQSATSIEQAWVALLPQLSAQGKYTHNYKDVALDLAQMNQGVMGLADVIKSTSADPAQAAAIDGLQRQMRSATAGQAPIVIQKGEQLDLAVSATVPLIVPFAYDALGSAKATQRSNGKNFEATEANVLLSVAQAYYAAAGTDELVGARANAVAVATDTFDNAKVRVEAGLVNRVEMTRAEVALVRAKQNELEAMNTRNTAYRSLSTLLGTHDEWKVQPADMTEQPKGSVERLVAEARDRRPEFAAYRHAIDAAAATARSSSLRWAPTVSAFGNARAFNYAGFAGDKYAWAVGGQIDWLLYDGGARDAQRHLANAQQRENEARLDLLRDTVTDEIAQAYGTLETKRGAVEAARRSLELSREALRLVRAQYEAGTAQQLDVLQAQDSLFSSEVAVAQAHFDAALAAIQLKRAAGIFPSDRSAR
jgi:OMF family outer membrane factor